MIKFNINTLIALLLVLLAMNSCKNGGSSKEVKEEESLPEDIVELRDDQIKLAGITMGTIEMRSLSGILKVNGTVSVAPQNLATVSAPMGGYVKSTSCIPGNRVAKGQVIATIENQEFIDIQQNYLEAKNKLVYAEAEYNRHSELFREDVYSRKNLEQVTVDYKSLKTQVKALQQKLALIGINPSTLTEDNISRSVSIFSPITGYVKSVNINIGKVVSPSDILFEIVNSDKLFLQLTLFEKDVDKVSKGQKIRFFVNNETESHDAEVYEIGRSVNADKSFTVFASVSDKCQHVLPGMYVNAEIEASTGNGSVPSLPSEAIVSFDDKQYVFTFVREKTEGGKPFTEFRMVEVRTGVSEGGYTEVILPEGFDTTVAKVVLKGAYNLLSAKKNAGEMAC